VAFDNHLTYVQAKTGAAFFSRVGQVNKFIAWPGIEADPQGLTLVFTRVCLRRTG